MSQLGSTKTIGLRFTLLYAGAFIVSGAALLALANLLARGDTSSVARFSEAPGEPGTTDTGRQVAELRAQLLGSESAQARRLLVASLIALVVMALISVLLGRIIARRVLRPLRTLTESTRRITAENLHDRLRAPGPVDEVTELADAIDDLLERLEASFTAQRRFVANASHELRTPLTTLRASVDVAMAKPEPVPPQTVALADRMRAELDQVDRLLEGLLVLARGQNGVLADREMVSFAELVGRALLARADDVTRMQLGVDLDLRDTTTTEGDRTLLHRVVQNLVDNAVVHNQTGGWIRVATDGDLDTTRLTVESGGGVLDAAAVARLGMPFERIGRARTESDNGAGLGLSIVAAVVDAHRGRLSLDARDEGGLRVTVELPVSGSGRARV